MKCLYVIEAILHEKIEGFKDLFAELQYAYSLISQSNSSNKKLVDLVQNILDELNGVSHSKIKTNNEKLIYVDNEKKKSSHTIGNADTSESSDKQSENSLENKPHIGFIIRKNLNSSEENDINDNINRKANLFTDMIISNKTETKKRGF